MLGRRRCTWSRNEWSTKSVKRECTPCRAYNLDDCEFIVAIRRDQVRLIEVQQDCLQ